MKDFLRQNGILLVIIALLLTILIGVGTAFMGGNADPLSNVVNTVTSPIRNGIAAAADWAEGVYNYVFRYGQIQEELDSLRAQVAELEDQVREGQEAAKQNERLRELLNLRPQEEKWELESATILERSSSNWTRSFTLSKGTDCGISVYDAVITSEGFLVGTVSEVGTNWCTVLCITDTDTSLGALVFRTDEIGVAEGDFQLMDQSKLKLSYLSPDAQLLNGDLIVTSGLGGFLPSGLVIGSVEEVKLDDSGSTQYAVLSPSADFDALTEVFVIKDFTVVE